MRKGLLALVLLLGVAQLASADYLLLIADLNANKGKSTSGEGSGAGGVAIGGDGGPGIGPGLRPPGTGVPGLPPGVPEDPDDSPFLVVAVLEVRGGIGPVKNYQKAFDTGLPVKFAHPWGTFDVSKGGKSTTFEASLLKQADGKIMPTVDRRYELEKEAVFKGNDKPAVDQVLKLASWALEHGLVKKCEEMLDKAADIEKTNAVVTAWLKTKADLSRTPARVDAASPGLGRLLDGFRATQDEKHPHFVLYHNSSTDNSPRLNAHLSRLENSFRGFYYWWVLKGLSMKVPEKPLLAVLTDKQDDFNRFQQHLTSGPVLADSFFARREGLAVYASKRTDQPFTALEAVSKHYWEQGGYDRHAILRGNATSGVPRGTLPQQAQEPRTYAVLLKALEHEWEVTSTSHQTSRQLLFASGLTPHNVAVPEWFQFGMGSFFETPLQSPWGGVGAPSVYWLPRFKDLVKDDKSHKPYDRLLRVVTDGYFRMPGPMEDPKLAQRHGRAASWSLAFYLAQKELDGLQRYCKELSKMPRDIELDEKVLLGCFARAFDCVDGKKQVDVRKLTNLAGRWESYMLLQPIEAETIHQKIREAYARMNSSQPPPNTRPNNPLGGLIPPGMRRPPGGGRVPVVPPVRPPGGGGRPGGGGGF
jgi:hypothetical protein